MIKEYLRRKEADAVKVGGLEYICEKKRVKQLTKEEWFQVVLRDMKRTSVGEENLKNLKKWK